MSDRMASITVDATVRIAAPLETVWAFVSDPERYPEWSVVTEEMTHIDDGQVGEGTVYREFGGLGPMTDESEWVITSFDEPHRQVHEGDDGTVQTVLTIEIDPLDGGEATRLYQRIELGFPKGFRLLGRILGWLFLRRMAAAALEETVENAKRIVESERTTTG